MGNSGKKHQDSLVRYYHTQNNYVPHSIAEYVQMGKYAAFYLTETTTDLLCSNAVNTLISFSFYSICVEVIEALCGVEKKAGLATERHLYI